MPIRKRVLAACILKRWILISVKVSHGVYMRDHATPYLTYRNEGEVARLSKLAAILKR
jgi:hypothetical protein